MLHELLLALLGYTGDLIIDEREHETSIGIRLSPDSPISEERTFKLAPDISFIEPSERYVLGFLFSFDKEVKFFPKLTCLFTGITIAKENAVSNFAFALTIVITKFSDPYLFFFMFGNLDTNALGYSIKFSI